MVAHEVDMAVAVKPEEHPELVIKPLHKEKVFLYKGSEVRDGKDLEVLYYHPDMISLSKILKKYQKWQRVPISNYEVLAHMGRTSRGLTLLPSPVAERVGGLKAVGKAVGEVPLALIYRYDRLKTPGFEYLKKSFYQKMKGKSS